jgi:hypothetical protein
MKENMIYTDARKSYGTYKKYENVVIDADSREDAVELTKKLWEDGDAGEVSIRKEREMERNLVGTEQIYVCTVHRERESRSICKYYQDNGSHDCIYANLMPLVAHDLCLNLQAIDELLKERKEK